MTLGSMQFAGNVKNVLESLEALGIDAPADLVRARDIFNGAMNFYGPPVDVSAASAHYTSVKDITAAIARAADVKRQRDDILAARGDFIDGAARDAQTILVQNTDSLLKAAAPIFRASADDLERDYRNLPTGWADAEQLVRAGAEAVAILQKCQVATVTLDACRDLRQCLPGTELIGPVATGATYAKCSDTVVAEEVCKASDTGPLGFWGQALSIPGVSGLQWHASVRDHRAYVASLPAMAMRHVKEGTGAVLRKVPA